jgi:hypothetical protein
MMLRIRRFLEARWTIPHDPVDQQRTEVVLAKLDSAVARFRERMAEIERIDEDEDGGGDD